MGGAWAKWVRGIKEDTCWDEHWVLYTGDESLDSTPKSLLYYMLTNLDVNQKEKKKSNEINSKRLFGEWLLRAFDGSLGWGLDEAL